MTLSNEYLNAVSMMIVYGQDNSGTDFNYYYYSATTYSTYAPTGVVAVLKNSGNVVATLTGYQISLSTSSVKFIFYDTSNNEYSFDEVDIYTEMNGTLALLVSRTTGLSYSKSASEAVVAYFTLSLSQSPSLYINYAFMYLLVPRLVLQNVFPFSNYVGITSYSVSQVSGTISFDGAGYSNGELIIFLTLSTTGGANPIITAVTTQASTTTPSISSNQVLQAILPAPLPSTSSPVQYPIQIGVQYEE
ncbi:hypothetical protein [Deltalipothrixvirus pozzuoliense]|uniref:Uncharacterized protein ORF246 n=1 Tax=Acidianus filamentous virus 2 (isolate Italy/Pozzuoli) TaxID=654910 RepID=Y246_AFV2P|nr:hypothetical protein AFV2_gp41 [Acidianus filamentous virus 2]Q573C8.1 RecName: Full=Uncharacterized protein ORF246 [Acidianus filamentous virus 2 (isolate Pozzuoli)]CAH69428.1 hypothetical protein [Acidianus filamentous virus 2]